VTTRRSIPEVYIPCCDASLPIVKINSYLFDKLWPDAVVHYLGFSLPEFEFYNKNHFFHSLAETQVDGSAHWSRYIFNFMKKVKDKLVILSLDDYLLCTEPNIEMIDVACGIIEKNYDRVGRFDLTFDSQIEGNYKLIGKIGQYRALVKYSGAPYRISTQPAVWNREYLLQFLDNDWSPWEFELNGSHKAKTEQLPQQTMAFYDDELAHYPIRTTAKGAVSRFNPGKYNVLGIPTATIRELVEAGFFTEEELIWGQHRDNPPDFYLKEGYNFHAAFLDYHPTSKTYFTEYYGIYDDPEAPLLTVNLWDNSFSHTLTHPDYGYISSQAEKAPRGKKIRYLSKLMEFNDFSGISIFTDQFLTPEAIKRVDSPIKVGWILEPPVVHPRLYQEIESYLEHLDYVFTFSDELSKKYEKCHTFPWCSIRMDSKDWGLHKKDKLLSMIASDKKFAPGHYLRHQAADELADKFSIDLWGAAFREFPSHGKILALKDYMFSIVVQNCQMDTFFTDFVDPLVTGTIPIFWGTRKVNEYFDEKGIIFFDTIEELEEILTNLTEEDYYSRLDAVKRNFETAKNFWRSDDQLADFIYKTVDFKKRRSIIRGIKDE